MAEAIPGRRYFRLSSFFRLKFGQPVYKIPLDAGFSCPNRDGTIGRGGCSYCYNPSFSPVSSEAGTTPLNDQLRRGKKKKTGALYLAYFQAYTNTHASPGCLRALYDQALADPDVVGLSIATRPDCISPEILDLLTDYARRCHLWVEYGLQSAHDATLQAINRGHSAAAFAAAVRQTRERRILCCAHVILGLPGETRKMMLETISFLNCCNLDGIKFHHLQVMEHTPLAEAYRQGIIPVYSSAEAYVEILCDCLEKLSPHTVVHRLAARAARDELLIAPRWPEGPARIAAAVEEELQRRGTRQGFALP